MSITQPSQPTTTLQALVNLKRPTLRLSPLTDDPSHHAVEFEYDADAPKCSVQVHVFAPNAPTTPVLVYEHVIEGGFSKALKLEDDAVLELSKYEFVAGAAELPGPSAAAADPPAATESSDAMSNVHAHGSKKRFSVLPFRKRQSRMTSMNSAPRVTAGPALQVVDVDADALSSDVAVKKDEDGVRVTIRLEALDDQGMSCSLVCTWVMVQFLRMHWDVLPTTAHKHLAACALYQGLCARCVQCADTHTIEHSLSSLNTQTTYLHVVRLGTKAETSSAEEAVEDTRPWVVKVVKREATVRPPSSAAST